MKRSIISYAVTALIGLAMALCVSFIKSLYWLDDTTEVMKALSDCFSVPGLILICFALLVVCSNGGAFDMLTFGVKKVALLLKQTLSEKDRESFYEYRKRKQENKRSFAYILIVGAAYLAIGVVFLAIFYSTL